MDSMKNDNSFKYLKHWIDNFNEYNPYMTEEQADRWLFRTLDALKLFDIGWWTSAGQGDVQVNLHPDLSYKWPDITEEEFQRRMKENDPYP